MARSGIRHQESAKRCLEAAFDLMGTVQSGPGCKMCNDSYYYLNTGETTTEQHKSPKYPHEPFKLQMLSTWAEILGAKMRSGPKGIVSFTVGKLMNP